MIHRIITGEQKKTQRRAPIGGHFCRPISGWVRVTGRAGLILSKISGTHERFCESMPDRVPLYLPRDTMISQAAA